MCVCVCVCVCVYVCVCWELARRGLEEAREDFQEGSYVLSYVHSILNAMRVISRDFKERSSRIMLALWTQPWRQCLEEIWHASGKLWASCIVGHVRVTVYIRTVGENQALSVKHASFIWFLAFRRVKTHFLLKKKTSEVFPLFSCRLY